MYHWEKALFHNESKTLLPGSSVALFYIDILLSRSEMPMFYICSSVNKPDKVVVPGLNLSWQFQKLPCLQLASFPQRSLVTTVSFAGLQA